MKKMLKELFPFAADFENPLWNTEVVSIDADEKYCFVINIIYDGEYNEDDLNAVSSAIESCYEIADTVIIINRSFSNTDGGNCADGPAVSSDPLSSYETLNRNNDHYESREEMLLRLAAEERAEAEKAFAEAEKNKVSHSLFVPEKEKVIYGKPVSAEILYTDEIYDGAENVCVSGTVFFVDSS